MQSLDGYKLHVYECTFCGGWHLTKKVQLNGRLYGEEPKHVTRESSQPRLPRVKLSTDEKAWLEYQSDFIKDGVLLR